MITVWPFISIPTIVLNLVLEYMVLTGKKKPVFHFVVRVAHFALAFAAIFLLRRLPPEAEPYIKYLRYAVSTSFLVPCLLLFSESLPQKIFLFFMDWGVTTFFSSFCVWVANSLALGRAGYAVVAGMYLVVFALLVPLYAKFWRNDVRRVLALFELGNPAYVFLPILIFVLFSALFGPVVPPNDMSSFLLMLLFESLVIFIYYLLFNHFFVAYERMRALENFRISARQLDLQKKYYEEVNRGLVQQRKLLHDARHHLRAISSLVAAGDVQEVGPYVDRLLDRYGEPTLRRYCENTVANAVIGGYINLAEGEGIAVSTEIDLPQDFGVDEYDLCALFGNAIENAIEACRRVPLDSELFSRRYVSVKTRFERGRLVIRVENSFKSDPKVPSAEFPSSKGAFGGVGLDSIRTVVERYGGCLNCERFGDVFALSAVVYPRAR